MKRSTRVVVVSLAILLLGGCASAPLQEAPESDDSTPRATAESPSSRPSPLVEKMDLAVVETAFGRSAYDPTVWWYVAILENPNGEFAFPSSSIDVEAVGGDGVILDTSTDYLTLLSGKSAVAGSFFNVGTNEIAALEIRGPVAASAISAPSAETGSFSVEAVEAVSDSYSTTVAGVLSGTFAEEQSLVNVVVVARNATGAIIGGERTYVERLPVEGKVRFEVSYFQVMPGGTTYEVYPSL